MKRLILALVLSTTVGCASLRQANGSLNIVALVTDAQWSLLAACSQQWVPPDGCLFGQDALTAAAAIAAKNQPGALLAVRQSLSDALAKLPAEARVRPYLAWLVTALAVPA
jgi:hypothetical protein